jgi:hypothetical protein
MKTTAPVGNAHSGNAVTAMPTIRGVVADLAAIG